MFPDPLQAIAAFARVAHHASFKRCRISSGAAGDIYSGDLVRVYVRLIYRRLGTFRQSDFDRLSSTREGRSQMRKAAVQIGCAGRFANEMTGAADLISAAPSSIPAIRRQNRIDLRFCIGLSLRNSFRAVSDAFSVDELHIRHTEEREHGFKKRHLAV